MQSDRIERQVFFFLNKVLVTFPPCSFFIIIVFRLLYDETQQDADSNVAAFGDDANNRPLMTSRPHRRHFSCSRVRGDLNHVASLEEVLYKIKRIEKRLLSIAFAVKSI